ncbi:hypothetical protein ABFA25_10755 [Mycobacterium lepromatosis]|nr:hypothetical protein [Mycobacterium lepromatosis]
MLVTVYTVSNLLPSNVTAPRLHTVRTAWAGRHECASNQCP